MARIMHPFNYCLIPIISIVAIFNSNSNLCYPLILFVSITPLLIGKRKLSYIPILIFAISLLPGLLGYFLASKYFSNNDLDTTINLCIRLFSLSLVSFIYVINLPSEQLIIELMQRKLISIKIGFALLATNNALSSLKHEFSKIQTSYKMRFGKRCLSPKIALPLLVAASRYAHNISISLHSRGISNNHTFRQAKISWTNFDNISIISVVIINLIIHYIVI